MLKKKKKKMKKEGIKNKFAKHSEIEGGENIIMNQTFLDEGINYLEHHGILGMKWGVTNGPPYPLGSDVSTGKRLKEGHIVELGKVQKGIILSTDKSENENINKSKIKTNKKRIEKIKVGPVMRFSKNVRSNLNKPDKRDTVTSKAIKDARKMSNEELQEAYNRLLLEQKYANVVKNIVELSQKKPSRAQRIRKFVGNQTKKTISKVGDNLLNTATNALNKSITNAINNKLKDNNSN